ncbi:hypothetical protein DFH07DRAFT_699284, partial [Mycena maculata]
DWQLNRKLNLERVPEWDGHGKTAIEYLCDMAELVRLSPQMVVDLGALKFKGRAASWWRTLPTHVRSYLGQSWEFLLHAIQAHFLNANWLQERRREWEEMQFRQHGHEQEWPLDFLQRRELYHVFLYPDEEDGVQVVDHLLQTAPDVWAGTINSERYPDIFSLMAAVRRYCATLMGNWTTAQHLGNLNNYYPCRSNHNAHAADLEETDSADEAEREDVEPSPAVEETNKDAFVASGFRARTPRPSNRPANNSAPRASSSRQDWPQGKTVKGYEFVKRDDIHSERAPANGVCYICSSANHFARDCPHYRKWLSLRDANMLQVDIAFDVEAKDFNEYIAMCAEVYNATTSAYPSETSKVQCELEGILVVDARATGALFAHSRVSVSNRNTRRRERFEKGRAAKGKGKEQARESRIPRRVARFKNK